MEDKSTVEIGPILERMRAFPGVLRAAMGGLSQGDLRWRRNADDWSIVEIVWHLVDEEELDFPRRLRSTIEEPEKAWPAIDPEGWASDGAYRERDAAEGVDAFERRRLANLEWLSTLTLDDLERAYPHPEWGAVRASVLFASWCAHDALHLRQISKRMYQLVERDAPGVDLRYAGAW